MINCKIIFGLILKLGHIIFDINIENLIKGLYYFVIKINYFLSTEQTFITYCRDLIQLIFVTDSMQYILLK